MDQLQQLAFDLQLAVIRHVSGHDSGVAANWVEDVVEEAFAEAPRPSRLLIYLDEIPKKAPRSCEIAMKIELIKQLIA